MTGGDRNPVSAIPPGMGVKTASKRSRPGTASRTARCGSWMSRAGLDEVRETIQRRTATEADSPEATLDTGSKARCMMTPGALPGSTRSSGRSRARSTGSRGWSMSVVRLELLVEQHERGQVHGHLVRHVLPFGLVAVVLGLLEELVDAVAAAVDDTEVAREVDGVGGEVLVFETPDFVVSVDQDGAQGVDGDVGGVGNAFEGHSQGFEALGRGQ